MTATPLALSVLLALLHLLAGRLRFLDVIPRSRFLSAAGGVSVAYVVVHLLPELAAHQRALDEGLPAQLAFLERHLYVVVLAGLLAFYAVELRARARRADVGGQPVEGPFAAFVIAGYALYNAVIGYLLVRRAGSAVLFAIAMGVHFVVNDYGLRHRHGHAYHRYGRWLVSAAIIGGSALALFVVVPPEVIGALLALVGGGAILNVLKEELPEDRRSRFGAFLAGAAIYTAVLLAA